MLRQSKSGLAACKELVPRQGGSEFQVADWLYSLYRCRLTREIEEWLAASRTDEERRIKGWLVHGFYQTRERRLIEYALAHREEEPPHVAAL